MSLFRGWLGIQLDQTLPAVAFHLQAQPAASARLGLETPRCALYFACLSSVPDEFTLVADANYFFGIHMIKTLCFSIAFPPLFYPPCWSCTLLFREVSQKRCLATVETPRFGACCFVFPSGVLGLGGVSGGGVSDGEVSSYLLKYINKLYMIYIVHCVRT